MDLDRVSLMASEISELPSRPPVCPWLTTLLLQRNDLVVIPDPFFTNMSSLAVLDLSHNLISSLPESISNLENLHAIILDGCEDLEYVPSPKKLNSLKVFKLSCSEIEELPEGIEELMNLRKLDLSKNQRLGTFPSWKLRMLSKLQHLRIDGTRAEVSPEDLLCLKQLKVVAVNSQYTRAYQVSDISAVPSSESEPFGIGVDQLEVPTDIDSFRLDGFNDFICLSDIPWLKDATDLCKCEVLCCNRLESIFSSSSFSEDGQISLLTVERFYLQNLPRYRVLFDGISLPHSVCFNLSILSIWNCDTVKNILPVQLLQNLPNLSFQNVVECKNVEGHNSRRSRHE
ncbi:hypothetical protein Vadar_026272 [Vaccinium darrowii]|uniref:Uncharacterized protein n=1 Tax=Vaccinium darrowii TaxID=229202 RepID=A0ACB7X452_9ERIC|nr:hypothetical protein Vadar_026272 [Vaccinium darrowii]